MLIRHGFGGRPADSITPGRDDRLSDLPYLTVFYGSCIFWLELSGIYR